MFYCMCVSVWPTNYEHVLLVCLGHLQLRREFKSPGTRVKENCELPHGYGPLQEQKLLVTHIVISPATQTLNVQM